MISKIFLMACLSGFVGLPVARGESCKDNSECHRPNTYCYASGECVDCLNCAVYQRQNGSKCAQDRNHCGDCLPGMTAEINIDGSLSVCTPVKIEPKTNKGSKNTMEISICTGILILLLMVLLWFCRDNIKLCPCVPNASIRLTSPPPYFEKSAPTAPPYEDTPHPPDSHNASPESSYHVENERQCANPYKTPDYVRRGHLNPTQNNDPPTAYPTEETDSQPLINNTVPTQTDEETQPSSWVPESNPSGESPRQNFTNILTERTNQLTINQPSNTDDTNSESSNDNHSDDQRYQQRGSGHQINIYNSINLILNPDRNRTECQESSENCETNCLRRKT